MNQEKFKVLLYLKKSTPDKSGKSREAVATNAKLDKLLLLINEAHSTLMERKQSFRAEDVKNLFQGSVETQMTLLRRLEIYTDELKSRVGVDVAKGTIPNYYYTHRALVVRPKNAILHTINCPNKKRVHQRLLAQTISRRYEISKFPNI